jgi:hypothetical protein
MTKLPREYQVRFINDALEESHHHIFFLSFSPTLLARDLFNNAIFLNILIVGMVM